MSLRDKHRTGVSRAERAQLIKAAAHPVRAKVLAMMAGQTVSPKEVAATLNKPIANVAYHVRELERAGLIELVDERKRRGATEHFYSVTGPMSEEEMADLSTPAKEFLAALTLHSVIGDAAIAAEAGTIGEPDQVLTHIPLLVDKQGWDEIRDILEEAVLQVLDAHEKSSVRLEEEGAKGIYATAALLHFEMPEPDDSRTSELDRPR
jgi:DNA-binding transcriptional ArsR family regulator